MCIDRKLNRMLLSIVLLGFTLSAGAQRSETAAPTLPMGWNSWNHFKGKVDDTVIRAQADAMVSSGMCDAGYHYVNIDATWQGERDAQGNIQT